MRKKTGRNLLIQVGQGTAPKREMLGWPPCAQKHLRELVHADTKPNREKRGLYGAARGGDLWGGASEPDVRLHGEGADTQVVRTREATSKFSSKKESGQGRTVRTLVRCSSIGLTEFYRFPLS